MNHATPEDIHDHVYGFRASEHVAECAQCGGAGEGIASEREALRHALFKESPEIPRDLVAELVAARPARPRITWLTLAAAAVLLATLVALLLHPRTRHDELKTAASTPPTQETEIDRLISELGGPSAQRRDIAWLALKAYGPTAVPSLEHHHASELLIDECKGISPVDQALIRRLKDKRITVDMVETTLTKAVEFLYTASGENVHLAGIKDPDAIKVTLHLRDATLYEYLELLKEVLTLPFAVTNGVIVLGSVPPPVSPRVPIRLSLMTESVRSCVPGLASRSPEERNRAMGMIRRLGFSAEPTLWELLDSPESEVRRGAVQLLTDLYRLPGTPDVPPPTLQAGPESSLSNPVLEGLKMDTSFENAEILDVLQTLSARSGLSLFIHPKVEFGAQRVTFKTRDLLFKNVLKLLLSQYGLEYYAGDTWILVSRPGAVMVTRASAPLWEAPPEARTAQTLLLDFASADEARRQKARSALIQTGRPALAWLSHASQVYPGEVGTRFNTLYRVLAESLGIWVVDQLSGVDLQKLDATQAAILHRPTSATLKKGTLDDALAQLQIRSDLKATTSLPVTFFTAKSLTLQALLQTITRSQGLDFYMSGETVIIDTAAHVRALLEK